MPELPWEKWFPTNWASEPGLRLCEAATRGIWFEAVNTMMLRRQGSITGTVEQLAMLCCCRTPQMELAISQLKQFQVADIHEQNGNIILECRRLVRQYEIKDLRRKAGIESGNKRRTQGQHDVRTPSASAYASASSSIPQGDARGRVGELVNQVLGKVKVESEPNGIYDRLKSELCAMYRRPETQHWSHFDESTLQGISRRHGVDEEWKAIRRLRASLAPEDKRFFPNSLSRLLGSWDEVLDRARLVRLLSRPTPEWKPPKDLKKIEHSPELAKKIGDEMRKAASA